MPPLAGKWSCSSAPRLQCKEGTGDWSPSGPLVLNGLVLKAEWPIKAKRSGNGKLSVWSPESC